MTNPDPKQEKGGQPRALRRTEIPVSPKHCLWFAWAPASFSGPEGEDETYRPIFDAVEAGAGRVRITVKDTTKKWAHHPSSARESGANGLDGAGGIPNDERGLENPAYRSAAYNSEGILPLTTNLNKLVAVFEIDDTVPTPTNPVRQEPVGEDATLAVPQDASKLFLGFHDGREWSNNIGDNMAVDVTWIV